eukprot:752588-Rhodomonas_salina.1
MERSRLVQRRGGGEGRSQGLDARSSGTCCERRGSRLEFPKVVGGKNVDGNWAVEEKENVGRDGSRQSSSRSKTRAEEDGEGVLPSRLKTLKLHDGRRHAHPDKKLSAPPVDEWRARDNGGNSAPHATQIRRRTRSGWTCYPQLPLAGLYLSSSGAHLSGRVDVAADDVN